MAIGYMYYRYILAANDLRALRIVDKTTSLTEALIQANKPRGLSENLCIESIFRLCDFSIFQDMLKAMHFRKEKTRSQQQRRLTSVTLLLVLHLT